MLSRDYFHGALYKIFPFAGSAAYCNLLQLLHPFLDLLVQSVKSTQWTSVPIKHFTEILGWTQNLNLESSSSKSKSWKLDQNEWMKDLLCLMPQDCDV